MSKVHTVESLIAFEERVKAAFLEKRIPAPVHLSAGNERQLLEIFQQVRPTDHVFSNWRSHYHALLKGIPEEALFDMILAGRSMYVMSREHRFIASSIVGGVLPIACGVAMAIKRMKSDERVFVFSGDMTSTIGIFGEFIAYAGNKRLPVSVVIEDNGYSTGTPTREAWGGALPLFDEYMRLRDSDGLQIQHYKYNRTTPHVGCGKHVAF